MNRKSVNDCVFCKQILVIYIFFVFVYVTKLGYYALNECKLTHLCANPQRFM